MYFVSLHSHAEIIIDDHVIKFTKDNDIIIDGKKKQIILLSRSNVKFNICTTEQELGYNFELMAFHDGKRHIKPFVDESLLRFKVKIEK